MKEQLRFYDIDGLRFIAAMMVVIYHFTFRGYAADGMSVIPFEGLSSISRYGYLGVDLFFIISGFVILLSAQHGHSAKFVVSRMVRIYPAFWVGVSLTALVMAIYAKPPFTITATQWLLNLPLVGSFVGVEYVDSVYWSLLVELKFYFLVFVLMCCGQIHRSEYFMGGWLIVSIAALSISATPGIIHFILLPEWSHYFVAGAMFYTIRTKGPNVYRFGVVALAYLVSLYTSTSAVPAIEAHYAADFSALYIAAFVTTFYVVFMLIALQKTTWINLPTLMPIGALTYPLYLVHQNIGFIFMNLLHETINKYLLLGITIAMTIALAWLINEFAEKRFTPHFKRWLVNSVNFAGGKLGFDKPI